MTERSKEWWAGAKAVAAAVNKTVDEDCLDIEESLGRIVGLLHSVENEVAPEQWEEFYAPEFRENQARKNDKG